MQSNDRKRLYAIDGLRFLAILGVIFYHMTPYLVPGGFLGVDLFLIISSYLLTTSLTRSLRTNGKIHLVALVKKRILRLLGPMFWMVLLVVSYLFWLLPSLLHDSRASILSGITFTNNWWQIKNSISYFEAAMTPNVFGHLWYIAILFQFTVIWAVLYTFLVRVVQKEWLIRAITVTLLVSSAILMAVLFKEGSDPTRVYYGTDTRAFSFLLGAYLSMVFPYDTAIKKREWFKNSAHKLSVNGAILGVTLLFIAFNLRDNATITYRGGMFVFAVLAAIFLAIVLVPGTLWHQLFSFKPMVWLGQRSYSYYMWYYPINILFQHQVKANNLTGYWGILLQLVLIGLLGEVSYSLIERHMFKKLFGRHFWRAVFNNLKNSPNKTIRVLKGVLIATVVLFIPVSFTFGLINATAGKNETASEIAESIENSYSGVDENKSEDDSKNQESPEEADEPSDKETDDQESSSKDKEQDSDITQIDGLTPKESAFASRLSISFFGDSTLQATAEELKKVFPNALFDGEKGRQLSQSLESLKAFVANGEALDTVVLMLGTNGGFSTEQIDSLIKTLGDRKIVLVTTHAPRSWQTEVNDKLNQAAKDHDNVIVVDWNQAVEGHDDWLYEDHIHPNPEGSHEFALFLARQLTKQLDND